MKRKFFSLFLTSGFVFACLLLVSAEGRAATRLAVATGGDTVGDCLVTPCTLDRAFTAAVTGDTIQAAAGVYSRDAVASQLGTAGRTLILLGAQSGVDARTRSVPEAEESILESTGFPGNLLLIDGENSVVDGLLIRNSVLGGVVGDPTVSGHQILNNIFEGNAGIGLSPSSSGASPTLVQHNLFKDHTAGQGAIYVDNGCKNITVTENKFTGNTAGSMNFIAANASVPDLNSNVVISKNELSGGASIFLGVLATGEVSDNIVLDRAAGNTHALAIAGAVTNLQVTGNIWQQGPGSGIEVSDDLAFGPNSNVAIHQNNISQYAGGCIVVKPASHTGAVDATDNYMDCLNGPGQPDCVGDATCDPFFSAPVPTAVQLSPATVTRNVGQTQAYTVNGTLLDGSGADVTSECAFASSDPSVATVDALTGIATAVGAGTATVTASCFNGGFTGNSTLQVIAVNPADLSGGGCALSGNERASGSAWILLILMGGFRAFLRKATP